VEGSEHRPETQAMCRFRSLFTTKKLSTLFYEPQQIGQGLHAHRAAGGDRNHWNFGGAVVTRVGSGERKWAADRLCE
jgi:hypothetical protein